MIYVYMIIYVCVRMHVCSFFVDKFFVASALRVSSARALSDKEEGAQDVKTQRLKDESLPRAATATSSNKSDNWLVVLTILKNINQWEGLSHILWKIKDVPNHQSG